MKKILIIFSAILFACTELKVNNIGSPNINKYSIKYIRYPDSWIKNRVRGRKIKNGRLNLCKLLFTSVITGQTYITKECYDYDWVGNKEVCLYIYHLLSINNLNFCLWFTLIPDDKKQYNIREAPYKTFQDLVNEKLYTGYYDPFFKICELGINTNRIWVITPNLENQYVNYYKAKEIETSNYFVKSGIY